MNDNEVNNNFFLIQVALVTNFTASEVSSTFISSNIDNVSVGDEVEVAITFNYNEQSTSNFNLDATIPVGMSYVSNSAVVSGSDGSVLTKSPFSISENASSIEVTSTKSFSVAYTLHYKLLVEESLNEYQIDYNANYDGVAENGHLIIKSSTWIDPNPTLYGNLDVVISGADGSVITNSLINIYDADGKLIQKSESDESGEIYVSDLPVGEYYLKQDYVPNQWVLNDEKFDFTISDSNLTTVNITNEQSTGVIKLSVTDQFNRPVNNCQFSLFNEHQDKLGSYYTDETGNLTIKSVPVGNYTIQETSSPKYYERNLQKFVANISFNQDVFEVNKGKAIRNSIKTSSVVVTSVDEGGNAVEGAQYGIYDKNGNLIEIIVTDENGHAESSQLPVGDYYIRDMVTGVEYEFNVSPSGAAIKYEFESEISYGQVQVLTSDSLGNPIQGIEFGIYDLNNKQIDTIITNENGAAISNELPLGSYYLTQIGGPGIYQRDDGVYTFVLDNADNIVTINNGLPIILEYNNRTTDTETYKEEESGSMNNVSHESTNDSTTTLLVTGTNSVYIGYIFIILCIIKKYIKTKLYQETLKEL